MTLTEIRHSVLPIPAAVHPAAFIQATDPGPVGAYKFWVDTALAPALKLYYRNAADLDWVLVVDGAGTGGGGGGSGTSAPHLARVVAVSNVTVGSAPATVDSVTLAADDRLLLTGQTAPSENGLWVFASAGAALVRADDLDDPDEFIPGFQTFVTEGTLYAGSTWVYITAVTVVVDTTALHFLKLLSNVTLDAPDATDVTYTGDVPESTTVQEALDYLALSDDQIRGDIVILQGEIAPLIGLNTALDLLAAQVEAQDTALDGKVAKAGDTMTGELVVPDLKITGLTGAATAFRLVGCVSTGVPVSGTFLTNDAVLRLDTATLAVCTAGGSPGTWAEASAGGGGGGGSGTAEVFSAWGTIASADQNEHVMPVWDNVVKNTLAATQDTDDVVLAETGTYLVLASYQSSGGISEMAGALRVWNAANVLQGPFDPTDHGVSGGIGFGWLNRTQAQWIGDLDAGSHVQVSIDQIDGIPRTIHAWLHIYKLTGAGSSSSAEASPMHALTLDSGEANPTSVPSGADTDTPIVWGQLRGAVYGDWTWSDGTAEVAIDTDDEYLVVGTIEFEPNADGYREITIYQGSTVLEYLRLPSIGSGKRTIVQVTAVQQLVAGSPLTISATHTAGVDLDAWGTLMVVQMGNGSGGTGGGGTPATDPIHIEYYRLGTSNNVPDSIDTTLHFSPAAVGNVGSIVVTDDSDFTVLDGGIYLINYWLRHAGSGSDFDEYIGILIDGGPVRYSDRATNTSNLRYLEINMSTLLVPGDHVEFLFNQSSGGTINPIYGITMTRLQSTNETVSLYA